MQQFTASDGACIAYSDQGAGRPLLLLHGLMAHHGFFRLQQSLARDFRLIAVDLRGHGASPASGTAPTVERLAADVTELCQALALDRAIGIGWSLGATILWRVLTGPASSRFSGAVVIDMTARVRNGDGWALGLSPEACEARSSAIAEDFEAFAAGAGQNIFAQPLSPDCRDLADWASFEFTRNDPAAIGALWASLEQEDLRGLIRRIDHPTLVIHGARSQLYGTDTAAHLVAALPNARALAFQRSGHAPHLEEPELFNLTVRDFAAGLPQSRHMQNAQ